MATITKKLLGSGPFFVKNDKGNFIPSGREIYRIKVKAEKGKEFSDFHLRIDMGRRLPGSHYFYGNNHNQIKILRPSSNDISQQALRDRGPKTRAWRGTYNGWNVPGTSIVKGSGNREAYINFYTDDCKLQSELTFDIVIADVLQIKEYWTTKCRKDKGNFVLGRATVVEKGETTEVVEVEVEKDGEKKKIKKTITKIKDHKLSEEKKKDIKQAKRIIKSVLEGFDKEQAFEAMEEAMEDFGYFIQIHEMPLYCDQNGECFYGQEEE